ncbi:uncharacterized protein LOC128954438 isoform X2 [Oppia nitens]|uniref:uncharacterized protein LOC128954438 isoform X2 n=1 Tax=Oppia nitens TaxID=1686743 RepID=UPI0023DB3296|nr:uncharacterized protein LOC128954438 isoform X2 [Oppia nitens]
MTTTTATMMTPKDSFDRFGDDLCQLLLQYLPIEVKLRLESVSKQWKSLIFTTETHLVFDDRLLETLSLISLTENKKTTNYFKTIVKKCPNITTVTISYIYLPDNYLELMIRYCNRLTHLSLDNVYNNNWLNSGDLFERFCCRFGQQLLTFKHIQNLANLKTLNIKSIIGSDILFADIFSGHPTSYYTFPKTLQSLSLKLYPNSMPVFVKFAKTSCQLMTSMDIDIDYNNNNEDINWSLISTGLSQMPQLRQLAIDFGTNHIKSHIIDELLITIRHNCPQLKSLSLKVFKIPVKPIIVSINKHLSKQLRRLSLDITDSLTTDSILTSDLLKRLNRLTHLTLHLYERHLIGDQFFLDIHRNLPRLQYINCDKMSITEKSIQAMGQLAHLMTVYLTDSKNRLITSKSFISNHLVIDTNVNNLFIKYLDSMGKQLFIRGINCL